MKKLFTFLLIAILGSAAVAQTTWNADPNHSKVTFTVTHMGISDVEGQFNKFEASATSSKPDFSDAVFELNVDIASINTNVDQRDAHLRTPDFFDAQQYPSMTFKSTGIKSTGKDKFQLSGTLNLHGVSKPVTMDLWYRGTIVNPQSKATIAGFQLTGTIKRSDFNIGSKFPAMVVSDEVKIKADGEFIKK